MRPEYALESLFEAVAGLSEKHPDVGVVIVGAKGCQDELLEKLDAFQLAKRSYIVGTVTHDVFLSLLRRCQVYLRSNRQEGTSSSIRESIYLGTPVIADNTGGHPEGVITYPWGDAEAIKKTLVDFFDTPNHDRTIGVEAPDTVALEAALLVRCTLGQPWRNGEFEKTRS
jgi:glycosyltransferase involved in cell wall biosynthesis